MIRRFFCALLTLALLSAGGALAVEKAFDENALLRLHVMAQDDTKEAQALKLTLRDTCLRCAEVCLMDAPDADAAYMRLEAHLSDFENACRERARALGYAGEIRAEIGTFAFPARVYGDLTVPAGDYRALRVVIGAGEGHNWWCVLYPSLCLIDETLEPEDSCALLDWLRARLGGRA